MVISDTQAGCVGGLYVRHDTPVCMLCILLTVYLDLRCGCLWSWHPFCMFIVSCVFGIRQLNGALANRAGQFNYFVLERDAWDLEKQLQSATNYYNNNNIFSLVLVLGADVSCVSCCAGWLCLPGVCAGCFLFVVFCAWWSLVGLGLDLDRSGYLTRGYSMSMMHHERWVFMVFGRHVYSTSWLKC